MIQRLIIFIFRLCLIGLYIGWIYYYFTTPMSWVVGVILGIPTFGAGMYVVFLTIMTIRGIFTDE